MRILVFALGVLSYFAAVPDSPRKISFNIEMAAGRGTGYTIDVSESGVGKYWESSPMGSVNGPLTPVVSLTVSESTIAKIFAATAAISAKECETHLKNIAQTGKKKLTYTAADGVAECVYNYSDDEKVNDATTAFQAIAQTIQTGAKLKHDHRFDHLGLDADLDGLLVGAKEHYAIELQNIAPILQSIVDDDEMMSPSRRKAKMLLDLGSVQAAPSAR
jgi:hypothetical protein